MNKYESALMQLALMQSLYIHIRRLDSEWTAFEVAKEVLKEKVKKLTVERFEEICEAVHNGWWEEKRRQGCTSHPDMIPYSDLSESVKDYDRVTVRRVLDALGIAYDTEGKT